MKRPDYLISTPENVDLHLELAGMGARVWAAFVDQMIVGAIVIALALVAAVAGLAIEYGPLPGDTRSLIYMYMLGIVVIIIFVVQFGYWIVFEGLWKGQTPGKRLVHIRVIDHNGQPVTWGSVFIRNLVRVVDQWLSMVGLLVMMIDRNERRLGDLAAGTLVIREHQPELLSQGLSIQAREAPAALLDTGQLTPDEYYLLVSFLRRRHSMKAASRASLARQLEEYYRFRLNPDYPKKAPEDFLEKLYLAYMARAELDG